MKITGDTTLAQLLVEKTALGITHLTINQTMINGQWLTSAHAVTALGAIGLGNGDSGPEAIDKCFADLRDKLAKRLGATKPVSPSR